MTERTSRDNCSEASLAAGEDDGAECIGVIGAVGSVKLGTTEPCVGSLELKQGRVTRMRR
jgi:hypothetical protein